MSSAEFVSGLIYIIVSFVVIAGLVPIAVQSIIELRKELRRGRNRRAGQSR